MKSFAYVVMGIAMIAVVVPAEFVLIHAETFEDHWCDTTQPTTPVHPLDVFCDPAKGNCNENYQTHFFATGNCVADTTEDTPSCSEWWGVGSRDIPIIFVPHGNGIWLEYTQLGLVGVGSLLCFAVGLGVGAAGGIIVAVGVGGVAAVTCGGIVYKLSKPLPLCDFGICKRDFTVSPIPGPRKIMCE